MDIELAIHKGSSGDNSGSNHGSGSSNKSTVVIINCCIGLYMVARTDITVGIVKDTAKPRLTHASMMQLSSNML